MTHSKRSTKLLAFLPALSLIAITAIMASGVSLVPGATAANTVSVSGNVVGAMSLPIDTNDGGCTAGNQSVGNFTDGAFHRGVGACLLTFNTTSVNGAVMTIRDNDGALPFFCTSTCGTVNNSTVGPSAFGPEALGDGEFGVALEAVSGNPGPLAGSEFAVDANDDAQPADPIWGPIGALDATVCFTGGASVTNQTCKLRFAVDGTATQTSGTYGGTAFIIATAT